MDPTSVPHIPFTSHTNDSRCSTAPGLSTSTDVSAGHSIPLKALHLGLIQLALALRPAPHRDQTSSQQHHT
eukprot:2040530-Rhodomonas_salina.3